MSGKWLLRCWIALSVVCGTWRGTEAAPPWSDLIPLKTVDADADKAYPLNESNGPWLIMACSFSGDGAEKQAQQLAYELRKRYKLPAYTYQGRFDPGEAQGLGFDQFGNPRKWMYQKYKDSKDKEKARHPELLEFAVLVGDYQSAEDPEAEKTLQQIKYATPQCLEVKEGQQTHQDFSSFRMIQKQINEKIGSEKKKLGPMGHAFKTPNPMLPPDYFAPRNGVDEQVVAMNQGVPYDLLDCPGKYTVQVATFKGQIIIKQDEIKAIEEGSKEMKGKLAEAAQKANDLTKALRLKGYEAYQFHDHHMSIVTIGHFDSVGTPRADGKIEINPEIHKNHANFWRRSRSPCRDRPRLPADFRR